MINQFCVILRKELNAYFNTSLAYILLAIYALISMLSCFYMGAFFSLSNTNLFSFFYFQTDAFIVLAPALTMRLWSEERKYGTIEFILTQPVPLGVIVCAKFVSAWLMSLLMLMITFPFWLSMAADFTLDNLNIAVAYLGAFLAAGAFCAIGCMISSFNSSPIASYMVTLFACWGISVGNFNNIIKQPYLSSEITTRIISSLNFEKHYYDFVAGQISLDNFIYFVCVMTFALWINMVGIEYKRS